jgi:hypothetical protein
MCNDIDNSVGGSFVSKYCSAESQVEETAADREPTFWSMSPSVGMPLLSIGGPLFHIATEIYGLGCSAQPDWGSSPFLNEHLKNIGWYQ